MESKVSGTPMEGPPATGTPPTPAPQGRAATRVGVALSGGGFRAAAFHLGVLKRLEELGVLPRIEALSCVSGGSITGALYALRCAERGGTPGSYPVDQLIAELSPVLSDNLRGRALFGTPARAARALWSFLSPTVTRIGLIVNELDRQLFRGAKLSDLPPWILVNATNLRTGRAWKFYRDRAGDYLVGATERTEHIRVAEAVAASAAYPGLADAYAFETRWEHLRGDILAEEYWERPLQHRPGTVSRWRERYGQAEGAVTFPLVDGGLYDNEGINGLRGRRVTHAIVSAVTPPESDAPSTYGLRGLLRVIDVVHDRLGAATRQLAHEMTHGVRPDDVTRQARALAGELRALAGAGGVNDAIRADVEGLADRAEAFAAVGHPPRGHQFAASAQILLHRVDLARNAFASRPEGIQVPAEYRGADEALVAELSRVRTDLDALEPEIVTLLMAQGYYLTDFYVKLTMPGIVFGAEESAWYAKSVAPTWSLAQVAITAANNNQASTASRLRASSRRAGVIGRTPATRDSRRYAASALLVATAAVTVLLTALAVCAWGVGALLRLASSLIG